MQRGRLTGAQPRYLLQAEHQRASALDFIHLPGATQRLLDDVAEVVVVLRRRQEEGSAPPRGPHTSSCLIQIVRSLFVILDSACCCLARFIFKEKELSPVFAVS